MGNNRERIKENREKNNKVSFLTRAGNRPCEIFIALLIPCAICFFLSLKWDYYYDLNDDTAMAAILSGTYTGTPALRNIQSYFPLTALLGWLYRIFGQIEWYGVFLNGCAFGSLFLVLQRIMKLTSSGTKGKWGGREQGNKARRTGFGLMAILFFLAMLLNHLVFIQYSVTVGILACASAFLFLTMEPKDTAKGWIREILPECILIWMGYLLRSEMMLFLSPLLFLSFLIRFLDLPFPCKEKSISNQKGRVSGKNTLFTRGRAFMLTLVLVLAGLCAGSLLHAAGYASEEWKEFTAFFDARTQLYDFEDIPEYEENEKFYEGIGLSSAEVALLQNYDFGLDEEIDSSILEETAAYADDLSREEESLGQKVKNALWDYRHSFVLEENLPYTVTALVLYLLAFLSIVLRLCEDKKKDALLRFIETIFVFAFRSILLLYLYYHERPVERLVHSVYLVEALILVWMIMERLLGCRKGQVGKRIIYATLVVTLLWALSIQIVRTNAEYTEKEEINADWIAFQEYCREHSDSIYFTDVYSTVSFSEKVFDEKDNEAINYVLLGGWVSKSPLEREKLSCLGLCTESMEESSNEEIIRDALLYGDNCYFVQEKGQDSTWLVEFYADKGVEITIQEEDTVGEYWEIDSVRKADES